MSRFGLRAFINKLAKADERQQEAAQQLRAMDDKNAPVSEIVKLLNELKKDSLLPQVGLLCLTTDLLEEEASDAANKTVGTETEFRRKYGELGEALYERLRDLLRSFSERNPMPDTYLLAAIEDLMEFEKDDLPRECKVPEHCEQFVAKTYELMPQTLRKFGYDDLADLFEHDFPHFKRLKQEGERFLIGMTYDEKDEQDFEGFSGRSE